MNTADAIEVVAVIQAAWPSRLLPDETVTLWAYELIAYDREAALEAARKLAATLPRPASLAELVAATRGEEASRRPGFQLPEPSGIDFADWLRNDATETDIENLRRIGLGHLVKETQHD